MNFKYFSLAVFGLFTLSNLAAANDVPLKCYAAADDTDRDGYARVGAVVQSIMGSSDDKLSCPSGYVRYANDCNDRSASVHPHQVETPFNFGDDNCNGSVDEPTAVYSPGGNQITKTGFHMTVQINDDRIYTSPNISYEVQVQKLSNSANTITLPRVQLGATVGRNVQRVTYPIANLAEAAVYRARLYFFSNNVQLGAPTDWYYSTTTDDEQKSQIRTWMVLQAFKQFDDSNRGEVGYRGTRHVDGTRFGATNREAWCSEFYAWLAYPYLKDIRAVNTVDGHVDYFRSHSAWYWPEQFVEMARRGDYLAMDTDGDAKKNHSGMVLAVDRSSGEPYIWTIEGNSGNFVNINRRKLDAVIEGLGHIVYSQLK